MISANQLCKHVGGRDLLEGATFRLDPGEKVALVGVNGSGKSTLLKICAGVVEPTSGEVSLPRDATVGYLPQHADLGTDKNLFEELRSVFDVVDAHFAEMEELAHRMGEVDHESEEFEKIAARYGHLQHEIDRLGAYEIDSKVERIMAGLGFRGADRSKPCSAFSGGWQMRILLGKLLLSNPDVLLLDEPTNHLDLETMIWLENWIRNSDCSVLLVSHERKFMDALAQRVFEIHDGRFSVYRGNHTDYLRQREERWAQWQREYDNQQLEMDHLKKFIDRFRYNASKASLVQSRVKALEKIIPIPPPPKAPASIHFRFPAPDRGSKEIYTLEGVDKAYGDHQVLSGVELAMWRGEKVALVGLNGAGKSTLLKMLSGVEKPTKGVIQSGPRVKSEYFAQYDADGLCLENTVMQEIAAVAPPGCQEQARSLLGGFFFIGEDVDKPVNVLSGGERTRLRLAKMLFSGANVLLLDEPTNHLDITSRATLERAAQDYEGTIILVSHDRAFLDAVATRVIEVKDGRVRSFVGNYSEYCHALRQLGETSPLMGASSAATGAGPRASSGGKSAKNEGKGKGEAKSNDKTDAKTNGTASKGEPAPSAGPISREAQRDQAKTKKLVEQIEKEIAKTESRLAEIEAELAKPEVYKDYTKSNPLTAERGKLQQQHEALMGQWERHAASLTR